MMTIFTTTIDKVKVAEFLRLFLNKVFEAKINGEKHMSYLHSYDEIRDNGNELVEAVNILLSLGFGFYSDDDYKFKGVWSHILWDI